MKLVIIKILRKIFARNIFYKTNIHLYKLSLRFIGILNSDSTGASGEIFLIKDLKNNMDIDIVFDVGANEGGYSSLIKEYIPNCMIYCFEPGRNIYKKLLQIKSEKVMTFNIGLSNKKSKAKFYDFDDKSAQKGKYIESSQASLYKDVFSNFHGENPKSYIIQLDTIDNMVKKLKIKKIDYLKIDAEGAELEVLKGAKKSISENMIKTIHFEFNEMNVYSRVFFKDFIKILPEYNFYRLLPNGYLPLSNYKPHTHEIFAFQNIVAIKKDIDWNQ